MFISRVLITYLLSYYLYDVKECELPQKGKIIFCYKNMLFRNYVIATKTYEENFIHQETVTQNSSYE